MNIGNVFPNFQHTIGCFAEKSVYIVMMLQLQVAV